MKITGIKIFKRKLIKNKKGNILKYISKKDRFIKKFGEIYFSYLKKNKKKGWNYHKKNNCFLICISGEVKIHLIDGRKNSKSYNKELRINLNQDLGKVLKIPPGIWFSLTSLKKDSILSNFLENLYEKRESIKKDLIKNYYIKN